MPIVFNTKRYERYDMKKTWGVISETLNRKVKDSDPETMTINGQDCSNKE